MEIILNAKQRDALSWRFNTENQEGEHEDYDEPVQITTISAFDGGKEHICVNGNVLGDDGEWTYVGDYQHKD